MHRKKINGTRNIVICGVGGQGIILASDVLCHAAFLSGYDVKKSEVHGMAQRGGSVITHVRFGKDVHSPLIEQGTCHYMLAFEKLEALRYTDYLGRDGHIIVDDREIAPMSVLVGDAKYPADIEQKLQKFGAVHLIDATNIAIDLGNLRVVNIILLGVLSNFLDLEDRYWQDAIKQNVKERFAELNVNAFNRGRELTG
ncbi:MAG: indolepyruvate oxidoreductase subunit beta [candidate division WOR-3 bacterium]|nr:indolepyruvate oxidoreductase subunit beta [candidate division WOR-3 bacterium]